MKKILLALALLLIPTIASAQCSGVFPANTYCGNTTASPAVPKPSAIQALSSTVCSITPSTCLTFFGYESAAWFSGATADVQINAAIQALPVEGGIVDTAALGCGPLTIAATIVIDSNGDPGNSNPHGNIQLRISPCQEFQYTITNGTPVVKMCNGSSIYVPGTGPFGYTGRPVTPAQFVMATFYGMPSSNVSSVIENCNHTGTPDSNISIRGVRIDAQQGGTPVTTKAALWLDNLSGANAIVDSQIIGAANSPAVLIQGVTELRISGSQLDAAVTGTTSSALRIDASGPSLGQALDIDISASTIESTMPIPAMVVQNAISVSFSDIHSEITAANTAASVATFNSNSFVQIKSWRVYDASSATVCFLFENTLAQPGSIYAVGILAATNTCTHVIEDLVTTGSAIFHDGTATGGYNTVGSFIYSAPGYNVATINGITYNNLTTFGSAVTQDNFAGTNLNTTSNVWVQYSAYASGGLAGGTGFQLVDPANAYADWAVYTRSAGGFTKKLNVKSNGDMIPTLPTNCTGHPAGTLWNNAGVVNVC